MLETRDLAGLALGLDISKLNDVATMNSSPTKNSRKNAQAQAPNQAKRKKGLAVTPLFTRPGVDPFD